jgi:hypothetical protein
MGCRCFQNIPETVGTVSGAGYDILRSVRICDMEGLPTMWHFIRWFRSNRTSFSTYAVPSSIPSYEFYPHLHMRINPLLPVPEKSPQRVLVDEMNTVCSMHSVVMVAASASILPHYFIYIYI